MTIFGLIVFIIVVGVVLGAINRFIPMAVPIKSLLNLFIFILLLVYILQFFEAIPPVLPVLSIFNF